MRITIIVLTSGSRDRLSLLKHLLKSIAAQTVLPDEVIVATESNGELIKALGDGYLNGVVFRVLETGYWNKCLTANEAILKADGDVIFLLEDDLYLTPSFIEEVVETFRKFPDAGCVYTNCIWVFPEGSGSRGGVVGRAARLLSKLTIHGSVLPRFTRPVSNGVFEVGSFTMSVACRREALLRAGLYDVRVWEPILGEDFDLAFRVRKAGYRILQNTRAVSYHFTMQVTKGSAKYRSDPSALMGTYATEVYFMAKNRDLLGLSHVITHAIYRMIESVMWGVRSGNPLTIIYGIAGSLLGLLRGLLVNPMSGVKPRP
ncbi:glycosyltransferase family 2 protein [Vulcanisaeta distributa]|uniref:Glycosyl transferase family 2 n=1 Tax=Vulcanisaeta distributa (strain DSM 14429 / JCM 11212 / NBRC 100878 / IC-017) TaxID=572478 RepID=E1QUD7_VULDI|nr:glycosyltransferase [Vulcanisaeta distributa]ADN49863.1 glycosyl transferase family 2 [Vulcanisaeta distributa DSM 14429]